MTSRRRAEAGPRAAALLVMVAVAAGGRAGAEPGGLAGHARPAGRARPAAIDPAPASAAALAVPSAAVGRTVLARLLGHRARHVDGRVHIDDAGGDGQPWVGVVERRGRDLWLIGDGFALRLDGPLARPRVAGPGYAVWATGARAGDRLRVHRLGVLLPPAR